PRQGQAHRRAVVSRRRDARGAAPRRRGHRGAGGAPTGRRARPQCRPRAAHAVAAWRAALSRPRPRDRRRHHGAPRAPAPPPLRRRGGACPMSNRAWLSLLALAVLLAGWTLCVLAALLERSGPIRLRHWAQEAGPTLRAL